MIYNYEYSVKTAHVQSSLKHVNRQFKKYRVMVMNDLLVN